jgi:hypothetical protein
MAISKKPFIKNNDIDSLINKGGSVPSSQKIKASLEVKLVQLRLTTDILDEIDEIRNAFRGHPKPSRHSWILNAIIEKIDSINEEKP